MKRALPYLFRCASTAADRAVYGAATVEVPANAMTALPFDRCVLKEDSALARYIADAGRRRPALP